MKIKTVVCLIVVTLIFTMYVDLIYGEEVFVFRGGSTVLILSTSSDGSPVRKEHEEKNDIYRFKINRSGYFIMGEDSWGKRTWYKGRIDASLNMTKQALTTIPTDANYSNVAISEDGKRVAWSTSENLQKSELTVEEYNGSESKILRKISVDGTIQAFSFSPNGDLLAYYWGPTEAITRDGFTLMLLDLKNPEKPPVEIAPPSLNTGMNPSRSTPPSWSPSGEFILFEAQYVKDKMHRTGMYIVSTDGNIFEAPFRDGEWSPDGKYRSSLRRIGDEDSGEYIIIETDVLTRQEREFPVGKFAIGAIRTRGMSPSGRKIMYFRDNEMFIYDTVDKNTVSYGVVKQEIWKNLIDYRPNDFFWISPKD